MVVERERERASFGCSFLEWSKIVAPVAAGGGGNGGAGGNGGSSVDPDSDFCCCWC